MIWSGLMDVISEKTDVLKILPEAAEELCSALFRNSPAGIYVTRNGKFIYTNIEFRRITGYSQDDLFGKDYQRLVNPRYRQKPKQNTALFLFGETDSSSHEFKISTHDGKKKWISEKITYFKYGGNWLTLGHWLDITEHHAVEKAWREAERRFQSAFEDLSTGLTIISTDGIFLKANKAFYDMVGYTEKEILESRFDEIIHPEERSDSSDLMQLFLSLAKPEDSIQRRLVSRDGRNIRTAMNISLIGDSEDAPSYFIVHFQDITEQKRIEDGLREDEKLYRSLVDQSLEPVAVLDLDCHLINVSQRFLRLLGYTGAADILGKKIGALVIAQPDTQLEQDILEILKKGMPAVLDRTLIRQDGNSIPAELHISWIDNEKGAPACIFIGFRDKSSDKSAAPLLQEVHIKQLHAFENITTAIALVNEETIITSINTSFEKLSGYSREEIEGKKSWVEFVAKEDLGRLKRYHLLRRLDPGSAPDIYEFKFSDRDGNKKTVMINISSTPGTGKTVATLLDLTSLKQAEKGFAEQWDSLAAFMDALPAMMCFKDCNSRIVRINQKFADFLGLSRQDIEGKKMADLMPDRADQFDLYDAEITQSGEPRTRVMWQFPVNGGVRSVRFDKTPLLSADGDIHGIMVEGLDITESQKEKESLREAGKRYQTLLETSPDAFFVTDLDGVFTFVSNKALELFGIVNPAEMIGKNHRDFIPPDIADAADEVFTELIEKGTVRNREFLTYGEEGISFAGEVSASLLTNEMNCPTGAICVLHDITARKLAEESLAQSHERLEKTMNGSIQAIAKIVEMRDPYTSGHQQRVALLAGAIARVMGLSEEQTTGIIIASKIHDIGKVYVPMEILSKPGILNDTERQIIQAHPGGGYDILKFIDFPWPVAKSIRQHHERLNGSGYPFGLKGDEIILEARIIMVADVVEAMASHRPYRPALGIESALTEITGNCGSLYDAEAVSACIKLFREKSFSFNLADDHSS